MPKKKKKAKPLYPSQGLRSKMKHVKDPNDLSPTEVAAIIGETYQRARNLMLAGKMGPPHYDDNTRKLTVKKDAVIVYNRSQRDAAT